MNPDEERLFEAAERDISYPSAMSSNPDDAALDALAAQNPLVAQLLVAYPNPKDREELFKGIEKLVLDQRMRDAAEHRDQKAREEGGIEAEE